MLLCKALTNIKPVETNILKAILTNSKQDALLVNLSTKYSARINVLFESKNPELMETAKDNFLNSVNNSKDYKKRDYEKLFHDAKEHSNIFLAPETARLLKDGKYKLVEQQSLESLYNPVEVPALSPDKDPFMFFSEYLLSLDDSKTNSNIITKNGKYYEAITIELKKEIAKSSNLSNITIKKLIDVQKKLSSKDVKIYICGAPIHSYYASSKSVVEINLICWVSMIFVIGLCYFYFKSAKILVPILASITIGALCGYFVTDLIFPTIHILTFVFSTTLIGISIDYSLHYFIEKDLRKILKGLTVSMLTTVGAFLVLLFSNIELLKQIGVFTSVGLFSVYLIVVLFLPLCDSKFPYAERQLNLSIKLKKKTKILIMALLIGMIGFGLPKTKFSDDVKSMYIPPKDLLNAEKLFKETLNQTSNQSSNVSFLIVKANDFEKLMQKEEEISQTLTANGYKYDSLSKFIPSINKQNANQQLIHRFYKNKLNTYATFLTLSQKQSLLNSKKTFLIYDKENYPYLSDFLTDEKTSMMILHDFSNPEIFAKIENVNYINPAIDISARIEHCRKVCLKLILPFFVGLFLILTIIYTAKDALKLICPSLLGVLLSFALLGIFNQSINLFHILAIFLIMGFGSDYAIFRFSGVKNSKEAVFMSCTTSIFSFFLLSMTSFKLVSSLGFILFLGLLTSYIFSLLLISEN